MPGETLDALNALDVVAHNHEIENLLPLLRMRQRMGQIEHGRKNHLQPWHDPVMEMVEEHADNVVYAAHCNVRLADNNSDTLIGDMAHALSTFIEHTESTTHHHLVFIAGPYRAFNSLARDTHIRNAREMKAAIMRRGHSTYCPHSESAKFEDDFYYIPDGAHLANCKRILRHCTALMLLPGWANSKGANGERDMADERGIPIFDDILQLPVNWGNVQAQWQERLAAQEALLT